MEGYPNGLGTPRAIDVDANGTVDYAYAGDVLGNFFRFDLSSSDFNDWTFTKIFEATYDNNGTTEAQPITTQPLVVRHPTQEDGLIVIFASGSYVTIPDGVDNHVQSIYGLWDRLGIELISKSDLVEQNFTNVDDAEFGNIRILSDNEVDYSIEGGEKGWYNDLDPAPAGGDPDDDPEFPGEKAIRNLQLKGGFVFVNSVIPRSDESCVDVAGGFALAFCPENGGVSCVPHSAIFDMNDDGTFDDGDLAHGGDTNNDGVINELDDSFNDVVVGLRFEDAVPNDSSFIGNERITQMSDKSIDRTRTNTAHNSINTGRLSWKQADSLE
jgi:type IV pilus assembly protein PilY1